MAKVDKILENIKLKEEKDNNKIPKPSRNSSTINPNKNKIKQTIKNKNNHEITNEEFKEKENQNITDLSEKFNDNKRSKFSRTLISIVDGSILTKDVFIKQIPFILFITFLTVLYIGNNYYAEKTIRKIEKLNQELKELKSEYITVKSEYMLKTRQSEIAKALANFYSTMEIKEAKEPPKIILVKEDSKK